MSDQKHQLTNYERLLLRQLKHVGLSPDAPPANQQDWQDFLSRVNQAYSDKNHTNYLLERSLEISSREMRELNEQVVAESEKKIRAYRHSEQKTEFLAVMSHEIRTPLNVVLGMANLLEDTELSDNQHEYVSAISKAGQMLLYLVNDVLDIAKIEAGKLELDCINCDLHELIRDVGKLFQTRALEQSLDFATDMDGDIPHYVVADPSRLVQVCINLLGNAFKFTEQGAVHLRVAAGEPVETADGTTVKLRFEVSDTGIGIADDIKDKLFDEYVQADSSHSRKFGGTGLGLAICQQLVDLMGGEIGVDSVLGKGSCFWFEIPVAIAQQDAETETSTASPQSAEDLTHRLLLVEDSKANQMLAVTLLQKEGYQVDVAENGQEALEAIERYAPNVYDLILMDIQMPILNGYEATRAIRNLPSPLCNTPIVAMTANVLESERDKCFDIGMQGYIAKPFKRQKLFEQIKTVIEQTGLDDEAAAAELIDADQLKQFQTHISEDRMAAMIDAFLQELQMRMQTVQTLTRDTVADWESLRRELHTMKGLCGTYAASALYKQLLDMETDAKEQSFSQTKMSDLLSLYDRSYDWYCKLGS